MARIPPPSATGPGPLLALAPMDGISDAHMRRFLTQLGGIDFCVTEFIRVTQHPTSERVLLRGCPELRHRSRTSAGTPVLVQLLGGAPDVVAESARRAATLGAYGIDLNFGCPARRVNGHDGGASLLRTPERIAHQVAAVRAACPPGVPVSAKIRLGWDHKNRATDIAQAIEEAGADWLTIHGRTRQQQYRPPADWDAIAEVVSRCAIPVIANGDIFDPASLARCQAVTRAAGYMIGRGAFRQPNLFRHLRGEDRGRWRVQAKLRALQDFISEAQQRGAEDRILLGRAKGWLAAMGQDDPALHARFQDVKRAPTLEVFTTGILRPVAAQSLPPPSPPAVSHRRAAL